MYKSIRETQILLAQLWDGAFNKKTIQKDLGLKIGDWDRGMVNLVEFMKSHKIKNKELRHLLKESRLISKMKHLKQKEPIKIEKNFLKKIKEKIENFSLCVKDETSFFAYHSQNYKLIENGQFMASGELTHGDNSIQQALFSAKESAYFFCSNFILYRKNLGPRPPRVLMRIDISYLKGLSLNYSAKKNRLFVDNQKKLIVFNTKTSKAELNLSPQKPYYELDLINTRTLLRSDPLRFLFLTESGFLILDQPLNRCTCPSSLQLHSEIYLQDAKAIISVCTSEKFLLVEFCEFGKNPSSDLFLVEITETGSLKLKYSIKLPLLKAIPMVNSSPLFCHGYVLKHHLIFSQRFTRRIPQYFASYGGWDSRTQEYLGVFDFNLRTEEMRFVETDKENVLVRTGASF